ncbi:NAD-glutamate dehydrogenase [Gordonia sp. TBRC 11910]|uniref:NAD-glutamate dehydrogenase n=1 Tax=Gordonia asplenii TaxID=2725283 RepID=A0A848KKL9_9ACTN|nr:NAD-glutamate dehydrogenase [Gordonia asplenii]NMN99633.1 NAD-glutamate dehydrogenase [Gordonia asplenii]
MPQVISRYFSASHGAAAPSSADADRVRRHVEIARSRVPGEHLVAVDAPGGPLNVFLVNDDMPLLVEAVLTTVESLGLTVGRVDHPIFTVSRDSDGDLIDVDSESGVAESWISLVVTRGGATLSEAQIVDELATVVRRVADVNRDTPQIVATFTDLAEGCVGGEIRGVGDDQAARLEAAALINWLVDGNFVPLGHLEVDAAGEEVGTGDGVWCTDAVDHLRDFTGLCGAGRTEFPEVSTVYLPTGISRSNYVIMVRIPVIGSAQPDGGPGLGGEHHFVGMLTTFARHQPLVDIPVLRRRASAVLDKAGVDLDSYVGHSMEGHLESYPLDELFATSAEELSRRVGGLLDAVATRSVRVFVRADRAGQMVSAMVYLPRERYTTDMRLRVQRIIVDEFSGSDVEYIGLVTRSPLAALQVMIHVRADSDLAEYATGEPAQRALQDRLSDAVRTWDDRVMELSVDGIDAEPWLAGLPESYKEQRTPAEAIKDYAHVAGLRPGDIAVELEDPEKVEGRYTFILYLCGQSASLTDMLPLLGSMGLDVEDEYPYHIVRPDGEECWAYEFGVRLAPGVTIGRRNRDDVRERFTAAFAAIWRGEASVDPFNSLVLQSGLQWRGVVMLRAYHAYLRQCGFAYGAAYVATVLGEHAELTGLLGDLFKASFKPDEADDDARRTVLARVKTELKKVISLDADRVISALLSTMTATSRTNFYVESAPVDPDVQGRALAFKLRPREIPQTPQPRPQHEIFVYSPRVEGVHLRFGAVARGGLRWSDRPADFRTEILGLVKAQAVKNAVIVPVGAKGGFVVKRPRGALVAPDGVVCYREFIAALLSVTDNIDRRTGRVIPAPSVVRHDGDDSYLVVAADKGTARFSDTANSVAALYDFWLGDAFASGGSAGYDHKAMGITAKGAWESVKRHFREMGVDTQTQDFTVVGVGDMSGDVFGNGMLLSEHIRLVAAFDHRHVFVDPNPVAAPSFAERKRMFALPRSSWADYDTSLISAGGGVWSRELKSIEISPQMRVALGLDDAVTELSPPDLIHAILLSPNDLLWNGGIGTYVKASFEANVDVGDKANDAIRVNGDQLRVKVVGEGGNLGVTERGRIEYDLSGGRINTDAMDNSAGVDCSDHEVNIKILLDSQVSGGQLAAADRNPLLESMTDEVAALVLADNVAQNTELGFSRTHSETYVEVHARLLKTLATDYDVDLELEALPTPLQLRRRFASELHRGLTSPELATLMAQVKLTTKGEVLASDVPDSDVFLERVTRYFPEPLQQRFAEGIENHRLRREIITTTLVNDVVDLAGATHVFRLGEGTGASTSDGVRAYVVTTEVFALPELWRRITTCDVGTTAIDEMLLYSRRLVFRGSRWMLAYRPQPLAMAAEIKRYAGRIERAWNLLPTWLGESSKADFVQRSTRYQNLGVPPELADDVAISLHRFLLLDIIDAADIAERELGETGELYCAVMEHLGVEGMLTAVSDLEHGDRWHSLARLALRDDLHSALRSLTLKILELGEPSESAEEKIAEWELSNASRLTRVRSTLDEVLSSGTLDLATLSVITRQLRSVIR